MQRCPWATTELGVVYHDRQWGVPVHDDRMLFEMLILEGAQAGLSWETILKKRENYRAAFDQFDAEKVASCGLTPRQLGTTIGFDELPVHYGCRIVDRIRLGTHIMLLGTVEDVFVRPDVTPDSPLEWCPWAGRMAP